MIKVKNAKSYLKNKISEDADDIKKVWETFKAFCKKRRLKKKVENRYNILKEAGRQKHKRKGNRCIFYALLPMGENDKSAMFNDEITPKYPYATHWFLNVYYWHFNKLFQLRVFPCSKFGGIPTKSPVRMIFSGDNIYEKVVEDIKKDRFWGADY